MKFATVDDYLASLPEDVRAVLLQVRQTIREAAPEAEETIAYQIPTFRLHGKNLVHVAGWKDHVSVYPVPGGDDAFRKRIAPYRSGKGTLRFPLLQPIPCDVIASTVGFLIDERGGTNDA